MAPFNPESASFKAGRLMLEAIDECIEAGHSFAFETTLSGMVYLKKISLWQAQGYQVKLWFLSLPNEEIAVSRVAHRVVRSGSTNLNSEISGNSGDNALTAMVRQTGVFHGQAEEEGRRCQTCTQAAHRRIQSAGGTCRVARGQNNDAVVSGI
ncbi:MAG: zeta toxin family protein [Burkholderiales bacterium]|nr:zeta toxin family protein [Burkholderiales bacterium]